MATEITLAGAPGEAPTPTAAPFEAEAQSSPADAGAASPTATQPPSVVDIAWFGAIAAAKALVIALAVDAFANSESPRYQGKGMKLRAIGYTGGLMVVPVAWRLLGRKDPYPRELDLAVTLPLLADAGGNAVGSRTDELQMRIDLSGLPDLPPGTYTGTLNLVATTQ